MASSQRNSTTYNPDLYLNPEEQDLLINALNSNMPPLSTTNGTPAVRSSSMFGMSNLADSGLQHSPSADSPRYQEPNPQTPMSAGLHNPDFDDSPYLDNELDETRFNWDLNADLIGDLPGASEADLAAGEEEHGDKRKSPEDGDDEDGGGKRHENEDKTAKKPGRKPLTSEPTTVRSPSFPRKAKLIAMERSARHRIALRNARSVSARRSTSRTLKRKSKTLRRHPRQRITKMVFCVPKSTVCRQN